MLEFCLKEPSYCWETRVYVFTLRAPRDCRLPAYRVAAWWLGDTDNCFPLLISCIFWTSRLFSWMRVRFFSAQRCVTTSQTYLASESSYYTHSSVCCTRWSSSALAPHWPTQAAPCYRSLSGVTCGICSLWKSSWEATRSLTLTL